MPAAVIPITGSRQGSYVLLEAALPGLMPRNIGVLLVDPAADRGWFRMQTNFDFAEDPEVLEGIAGHLEQLLSEMGAAALLDSLEDSLSNVVRISDRQAVAVDSFTRVLDRLYREHVEAVAVRQFETHLPLYSLRAAAGRLGEEMESEEEDWVFAPKGMRLTPDLFVAHVVGRSMEPRIPDGSLNLFRLNPVGSRQNKILLIQRFGALDETARYTVKRYTSNKVYRADGSWEHEQIRLEPLNPEFEAWDVGPQDFAVVAEWIRVIE
jgi:SOS-response transcriptional repressor LexA